MYLVTISFDENICSIFNTKKNVITKITCSRSRFHHFDETIANGYNTICMYVPTYVRHDILQRFSIIRTRTKRIIIKMFICIFYPSFFPFFIFISLYIYIFFFLLHNIIFRFNTWTLFVQHVKFDQERSEFSKLVNFFKVKMTEKGKYTEFNMLSVVLMQNLYKLWKMAVPLVPIFTKERYYLKHGPLSRSTFVNFRRYRSCLIDCNSYSFSC